jgi:AcrR family transcriptional regulator
LPKTVNRREDLLDAAITAFVDRGYEGTSVADLATATGLSKAAFVYHFESKEQLLFELAEPLLDELDSVADRHEGRLQGDRGALLGDYLATLCAHRQVVEWLDGDKSILNHGDLGTRLDLNNQKMHELLARGRPSKISRAQASAILGMLWRPVRNGYLAHDASSKAAVLTAAVAATDTLET